MSIRMLFINNAVIPVLMMGCFPCDATNQSLSLCTQTNDQQQQFEYIPLSSIELSTLHRAIIECFRVEVVWKSKGESWTETFLKNNQQVDSALSKLTAVSQWYWALSSNSSSEERPGFLQQDDLNFTIKFRDIDGNILWESDANICCFIGDNLEIQYILSFFYYGRHIGDPPMYIK